MGGCVDIRDEEALLSKRVGLGDDWGRDLGESGEGSMG